MSGEVAYSFVKIEEAMSVRASCLLSVKQPSDMVLLCISFAVEDWNDSFQKTYLAYVKALRQMNKKTILVATRCDKPQIDQSKIDAVVKSLGLECFKTSASTGMGMVELLRVLEERCDREPALERRKEAATKTAQDVHQMYLSDRSLFAGVYVPRDVCQLICNAVIQSSPDQEWDRIVEMHMAEKASEKARRRNASQPRRRSWYA